MCDQYGSSDVFPLAYRVLGTPPRRPSPGRMCSFEPSEALSYWLLTFETQDWYRYEALKRLSREATTLIIHFGKKCLIIANSIAEQYRARE